LFGHQLFVSGSQRSIRFVANIHSHNSIILASANCFNGVLLSSLVAQPATGRNVVKQPVYAGA
jgi:hypothetical protein